MATQAEVKTFIEANFNVEELENDLLKFTFEAGDSDRSQLVFAFIGPVWLESYSPFATTDQINAAQAINANDSVFGVGTIFDFYCLKQATAIENIDPNEIESALLGLAGSADTIEKKLGLGDVL